MAVCTQAQAADAEPLRLCADPANLPFSSDDPKTPGLYNEIGEALGNALGRPTTHVWYRTYFGKRSVRVTLLAGQCDITIGVPLDGEFMGPAVIFSNPLFRIGNVVALPKGASFRGLDDLKGKRVAVQFQTSPQSLLATRDDIEKVTVLSPEAGMAALASGTADAAFVWGPNAAWVNRTAYEQRFELVPVDGAGLSWPVAIGLSRKSTVLRDRINEVLPSLAPAIAQLSAKYGLPAGAPVPMKMSHTSDSRDAGLGPILLAQAAPSAGGATRSDAGTGGTGAAPKGGAGNTANGKTLFNGTCAHCHGPDAVQADRRIDLRLLQRRHGDDARAVYLKTVIEGRPAKGMPAWKEVFTAAQLEDIFAYLQTVQAPKN